jgi:hypothetical protein
MVMASYSRTSPDLRRVQSRHFNAADARRAIGPCTKDEDMQLKFPGENSSRIAFSRQKTFLSLSPAGLFRRGHEIQD